MFRIARKRVLGFLSEKRVLDFYAADYDRMGADLGWMVRLISFISFLENLTGMYVSYKQISHDEFVFPN